MRLKHTVALAGLGLAFALATAFALAGGRPPTAQPAVPPSDCAVGARTSADPASLILGDTTLVTTVITHSCGPFRLPMDIVFLVDISNSMTKARGNPNPGDGSQTPKPTIGPNPSPPPIITPILPLGAEAAVRVRGLAQNPPTPTEVPVFTPGTPDPNPSTPTPKPGTGDEAAGTEDLIKEVREAIYAFLDEQDVQDALDSGKLQIGLVSFNDRARTETPLTDNDGQVRGKLLRLRGTGNTNVGLGLRQADLALRGNRGASQSEQDRVKVIMLFSDGKFDERSLRGGQTRDQTKILTVAAGRSANVALMRRVATEREFAITTRDHKELMKLYRSDLPKGRPVTLETLTVREELAGNMALISDTVAPAPSSQNGTALEWVLAKPADRVTLTYQVRPLEAGTHPVMASGEIAVVDSEARASTLPLPNVDVEAIAPTETPTPTATPTDTPTPTATPTNTEVPPTPTVTPGPRYMPLVLKDNVLRPSPTPKPCVPSEQTVDVVLVIDTSNSMLLPTTPGGVRKLDAAIEAGRGFLDYLKLPPAGNQDQVAIVWFNGAAGLESPLTGDRAAIEAALDRLPLRQAPDTHINKGLDVAYEEMVGPRHRAQNNRAIILLTDGEQDPAIGDPAVIAAADRIKAAGITLWTIGLGQGADQDLLRQVATSPEYFKFSPDAADLKLIYEEIARVVPCG